MFQNRYDFALIASSFESSGSVSGTRFGNLRAYSNLRNRLLRASRCVELMRILCTLISLTITSVRGATFTWNNTTTLTAIQQWRLTHFSTTDNAGWSANDADWDSDGVSNLLEYACGTSPTITTAQPVQGGAVANHLRLVFPRSARASGTVTITDGVDASTVPVRFLRLRVTQP